MSATAGRKHRKKALAIGLAFLAVAGLVAASVGRRWLTTADRQTGVGLRELEHCDGSTCAAIGNDRVVDEIDERINLVKERNETLPPRDQEPLPRPAWHGWPTTGLIAFLASLLAAAGLLGGAVVALAGKRPVLPVMPTTVAVLGLLIALIAGCVFVATKPDLREGMAVGWTFITFGGAVVVGLAAVFPLNRAIRPIDEELGEGSATMSWGVSRDDA